MYMFLQSAPPPVPSHDTHQAAIKKPQGSGGVAKATRDMASLSVGAYKVNTCMYAGSHVLYTVLANNVLCVYRVPSIHIIMSCVYT